MKWIKIYILLLIIGIFLNLDYFAYHSFIKKTTPNLIAGHYNAKYLANCYDFPGSLKEIDKSGVHIAPCSFTSTKTFTCALSEKTVSKYKKQALKITVTHNSNKKKTIYYFLLSKNPSETNYTIYSKNNAYYIVPNQSLRKKN